MLSEMCFNCLRPDFWPDIRPGFWLEIQCTVLLGRARFLTRFLARCVARLLVHVPRKKLGKGKEEWKKSIRNDVDCSLYLDIYSLLKTWSWEMLFCPPVVVENNLKIKNPQQTQTPPKKKENQKTTQKNQKRPTKAHKNKLKKTKNNSKTQTTNQQKQKKT